MSCGDVRQRLDDYLDGELPEKEAQEVELHVAGCAECAAEERALQAIVASARALPRELQPSRDLWAGIRRGIEEAPPSVLPFRAGRERASRMSFGAGLAAAAAVVAALASLITVLLLGHAPADRVAFGPDSSAPITLRPVVAAGSQLSYLEGERDYVKATAELLAAVNQRRDRLTPETRATVEHNLKVIDKALGEVREALRSDPGNGDLSRMLGATHRKNIETLQRLVRLTSL